jgi:outer membrane PBP1 activator LpoA protein
MLIMRGIITLTALLFLVSCSDSQKYTLNGPSVLASGQGPVAIDSLSTHQTLGEDGDKPVRQVALLLPQTGSLSTAAKAVHDGVMDSYYQSPNENRPIVRVYDVSKSPSVAAVYQRAVQEGADVIIGPLSKPRVDQLLEQADITVPVLTLNFSSDAKRNPQVWQFGLSPLDEASEAAVRARQDGRSQALVMVPEGEWGKNIAEGFTKTFKKLGGTVVDTMEFTERTHFDKALKSSLQIKIGLNAQSSSYRQDIDMIFLVAQPIEARQIRPLLSYYHAGNLPVYATSATYSGVPSGADKDLDGIVFSDMPWLIKNPALTKRPYPRLYAMGRDAYKIALNLPAFTRVAKAGVTGDSGQLYMGRDKQIHRRVEWARFQGGVVESVS